jgi:5-formyltetrahydrofolate cyclo-ligase
VAIHDSPSPKAALRKLMRQALHGLPATSETAQSAIHQWLTENQSLRIIAIYSALPGEIDLSAFIQRHDLITWVFPKVRGDALTFHTGEDLRPGAFGILEPADGSAEVPVASIDAFICPGLAFDLQGGRLGRGRGFYDRMLSLSRPDALKIGICFPSQIVPNTFSEIHDVPMDRVLC